MKARTRPRSFTPGTKPTVYEICVSVDLNGDWIHSVPDVRPPHRAAVAAALKSIIKELV